MTAFQPELAYVPTIRRYYVPMYYVPMFLLLGGTRAKLIVIIYNLNETRKIKTITHRSGSGTIYDYTITPISEKNCNEE